MTVSAIFNTLGPLRSTVFVFLILTIVIGYYSQSIYGPYFDKHSTTSEVVIRKPWHKTAVIISALMVLAFAWFCLVTSKPAVSLSLNVFLTVTILSITVIVLTFSCPYSITLDLPNRTYKRTSGWLTSVTQGPFSDITSVSMRSGNYGGTYVYLCKLNFAPNKSFGAGRFRTSKDAEDFAKALSLKLNVPATLLTGV